METTTKHTPTPWGHGPQFARHGQEDAFTVRAVVDNFPKRVAIVESEEDAMHLVKAVNSYEALVEALRDCVSCITDEERLLDPKYRTITPTMALNKANALLSQLEGQK